MENGGNIISLISLIQQYLHAYAYGYICWIIHDCYHFRTADSKLNNFTRIESVVKLLEIPYDTNAVSIFNNKQLKYATPHKLLLQRTASFFKNLLLIFAHGWSSSWIKSVFSK